MSGVATLASQGVGGIGFAPITHNYTTPGTGAETIQTSASTLVVKVWAGGGGGSNRSAAGNVGSGGGSAYSKATVHGPFAAGTIDYTVGAGGARGAPGPSTNGGSGGTSSAGGV